MSKMAILLSTDDWAKLDVFKAFLATHPKSLWRTQGRYKPEFLAQIPYPLNVYFFHRNIVRYRATCIGIFRDLKSNWPLSETPVEFRSDPTPFTMFVAINRLDKIADTHVSVFSKWNNPSEHFSQGQLGLLKVRDILEVSQE